MNARRSVITLLLVAAPAWSQAIYRCGDSYGETACERGRRVEADDPRSAAQKAQTDRAAHRDARLAEGMRQERLRREAAMDAANRRAAQARRQAAADKPDVGFDLPAEPEMFTARVPGKPGEARRGKSATRPAAKPRQARIGG